MNSTVKIIECISNTFQGEGPDSGQRMMLIRFKYCNKKCKYCDTLLKMRISVEGDYKLEDLQNIIERERVGILISGGEISFGKHFDDTVNLLNNLNYPIANVESNGYNLQELISRIDKSKNINYMYSPKIFSEEELNNEIEKTNELKGNNNVYIKVVYQEDLLIKKYLEYLNKLDINQRVYLMPEGKTREELLKNSPKVFDAAEKYKFNFSSRTHIIYNFI